MHIAFQTFSFCPISEFLCLLFLWPRISSTHSIFTWLDTSIFWNLIHRSPLNENVPSSSPTEEFTFSFVQSLYIACISTVVLIHTALYFIVYIAPPLWLCFYFSIQFLPECVEHIKYSTIFAEWKNGRRQNSERAKPGLEIRAFYSQSHVLLLTSPPHLTPKSKAYWVSFAGCHLMSHVRGLTLTVRFTA